MSRVAKIEPFILTIPRDDPYLGELSAEEKPNDRGYFVRKGNRTVYPIMDRSVLVRIETESGAVGWGETYGLVAPRAVTEIISDLLAGFLIGRDVLEAEAIHDDFYNLMRVRGYTGGFYLDALAAVDIALWDVGGRLAGKSVAEMLGGRVRETLPCYVSGLPGPTLEERAALAVEWAGRGYDSFKYASPAADQGMAAEIVALREALGPDARIACDMHWVHTPEEAISEIRAMEPHGLWFAEAPVEPENIKGLAQVTRSVNAPVAVGEEWRTLYEAQLRLDHADVRIVQPEMGHTGITEFVRIAKAAQERGIDVIPHATIGSGIFLAASIQASLALENVVSHEFQHTIFGRKRDLITDGMDCREGTYRMKPGPGLGIEPTEAMLAKLER